MLGPMCGMSQCTLINVLSNIWKLMNCSQNWRESGEAQATVGGCYLLAAAGHNIQYQCTIALSTQTENGSRALAMDGVQHNKHMLCLSVVSLKKSGFKRAAEWDSLHVSVTLGRRCAALQSRCSAH
jgi:hypothetical protein